MDEHDDSDDINIVSDSDITPDLIESDSGADSDVEVVPDRPSASVDNDDDDVVVVEDVDGGNNFDRTMATLGLQRVQQLASDVEEERENEVCCEFF